MIKNFFKIAIINLIRLLFIISFIICFGIIFGDNNRLISIGLVTGLIMYKNVSIGINPKQAPFVLIGLCLLIGLSSINIFNIYFAIILNLIIVYIYMTFTTINISFKTYVPFNLMYAFSQMYKIEENEISLRIIAFLCGGILLAIVHYVKHKNEPKENTKTIKQLFEKIHWRCKTNIFSIKMTIGVAITIFFVNFFQIQKGLWILMTVMALIEPHFTNIKLKIKHRLIGTILGIIIFYLLFGGLIPSKYFTIITGLLTYIYTFVKRYDLQTMFVTISALNATTGVFDTIYQSGFYRISFVFIGTFISLFIIIVEKLLNKLVKEYPSKD